MRGSVCGNLGGKISISCARHSQLDYESQIVDQQELRSFALESIRTLWPQCSYGSLPRARLTRSELAERTGLKQQYISLIIGVQTSPLRQPPSSPLVWAVNFGQC